MKQEQLAVIAEKSGFSHWGIFSADKLEFRPEVRDMCAQGKCGMYGKCWTCPPACDSLEIIAKKASEFKWGLMVQLTGRLEDNFDVETMLETEQLHKEKFSQLVDKVRKITTEIFPMGVGACTLCESCTYPHMPCRLPEKTFPSMESCGLVVTQVCNITEDVKYYYGPLTMTYSSCVLFND